MLERRVAGDIFNEDGREVTHFITMAEKGQNWFSLLRVCRQIYWETAVMPFQVNTFRLPSLHANTAQVLKPFLDNRLPVELQ